jgi:hypothetical protein
VVAAVDNTMLFVLVVIAPFVRINPNVTVAFVPSVKPAELFSVNLVNVVANDPFRLCGVVPANCKTPVVPVNGVAEALFIKLPFALRPVVPSAIVPEVSVKTPLTVGAAASVNVLVPGVNATVRLLNVVTPVRVELAAPVNETIPVPGMNPDAPAELVQAPFISILNVPAFKEDAGAPVAIESVPLTVILLLSVTAIPPIAKLPRTDGLEGNSGPVIRL